MTTVLVAVAFVIVIGVREYAQHLREARLMAQNDRLCQRIQAPDVAVQMAVAEAAPDEDDTDDVSYQTLP
jgi:hypothetical protein